MTAYSRGARFERRVRRHLEGQGYFVVRAAGSRGPFDLVALKRGRPPLLVQCSAGPIPLRRLEELIQLAGRIGGIGVLAYRMGRKMVMVPDEGERG